MSSSLDTSRMSSMNNSPSSSRPKWCFHSQLLRFTLRISSGHVNRGRSLSVYLQTKIRMHVHALMSKPRTIVFVSKTTESRTNQQFPVTVPDLAGTSATLINIPGDQRRLPLFFDNAVYTTHNSEQNALNSPSPYRNPMIFRS